MEMKYFQKNNKIRTARIKDSCQIEKLITQLGYHASVHEVATRISQISKDQNQIIFVCADDEDAVIGWVHALKVLYLESEPFVEIGGLVVDLNHRGKGIGKSLMQAVERWSFSKNLYKIRLRSNSIRSEAHIFYKKIGFKKIKTQYTFYKKIN